MEDAETFLGSYKEALTEEVSSGGLWPPELLAYYEPESCLKHSGAKEVYLACDRRTGARVVLRASDLDAGERADAEHAILSRLDFPGIPKTYGTFIKEGRSYLCREYFEGEPLDQLIARGTLAPDQIYPIARQICTILGYLHEQVPPVIHRDIKPQNIICRPDGSIGLTDFGIARTYKEGSSSDTQYMGTLLYAPPEQYGYAQSSPQTDIYALGIVLVFLATGSPDRRDLSRRIVDSPLRSLIEKCIAFDPADRFQNVQQVIRRIDSFKTRKTRITLGIIAACFAALLLAAGAWFLATQLLGEGLPLAGISSQNNAFLVEAASGEFPDANEPRLDSSSRLYDYNTGGNLQGNINIGGFAVTADDGKTLFVIDKGNIYKLDDTGAILSQVFAGSAQGGLNYYENCLYFYEENGTMHRLDLGSGEDFVFGGMAAQGIYFDSGTLYFLNSYDFLRLYTVGVDGSFPALVDDNAQTVYGNVVDGIHYYVDSGRGNRIYARELSSGNRTLVYNRSVIWTSVWNGRIYFLDDERACLASVALDGSDFKVVYGNPCYYVVASARGIFAMDAIEQKLIAVDATNAKSRLLMDREVEFCVAGNWVVYRDFDSNTILGLVSQDGSVSRLSIVLPLLS